MIFKILIISFIFISMNIYGNVNNNSVFIIENEYLDKEEVDYLNKNKELIVGVYLPSYPPFSIVDNKKLTYTGMSSDILSIISEILKIKINLKFFDSKSDAITALINNDIDIIPSANLYFLNYGLTLSEPYFSDLPIIFRSSDKREIKSIAINYDYLDLNTINDLVQDLGINIKTYLSRSDAIAAAAFGETDAVISDLLSLNYSYDYNYIGDLIYDSVLDGVDTKGVSFALNKDNQVLLSIINKSIRSVDTSKIKEIVYKWNGSGIIPPSISELNFIREKILNLFDRDEVSIVISPYQPPFSYVDEFDNPQGILIEVLNLFNLYSGVNFNIIVEPDFDSSMEYVLNGQADLIAMNISENRKGNLTFSNILFTNPFVYITNKDIDFNNVKTVYVTKKNVLGDFIDNSDYDISKVENYIDAFKKVAKDKRAAAIMPISVANYYISKYHHDELMIQRENRFLPVAQISMATNKNDYNLIDFINSLLNEIPRSQFESISGMWRKNTVVASNTWKDYKYTVYTLTISITTILMLFMIYVISNKRVLINERRLKEENNDHVKFLQNIIDSIPHPVYFIDKNFKVKVCNEEFKKFFNGDSMLDFLERFGTNQFNELLSLHKNAFNANLNVSKDLTIHLDNKRIIVYHWVHSYFDLKNNINGVIGGWLDISERTNLLEELEYSKRLAEDANAAKSIFLATVSHEIRTPMNIIIGALDLVLNFDYNIDEKDKHLRIAYSSAKDLLSLIGDILDISKIEANELSLDPKEANLKEVIESMFNMFLGLSKQKNIQFINYYDKDIHDLLIFDDLRFKQVLLNIIGNAVKFTDAGSIEFNVFDVGKSNGCQKIKVVVKDTGLGIKEEELGKLFKAFSQTSSSYNRGGTGLGLMISKELCALMGGYLKLSSQFGAGTTISCEFSFPMIEQNIIEPNIIKKSNKSEFIKKKVLLVDDHPSNRIILSKQIEKLGHDVLTAIDGYDALSTLQKDMSINVIITDCHMPNMDGYELTKKIRSDSQSFKNILIFGLTANAQIEVKEKCINAGMNDCLFKPLDVNLLGEMIQNDYIPSMPSFEVENIINESTIINLKELGVDLTLVFNDFLSAFNSDIYKLTRAKAVDEKMELIHRIKSASNVLGFAQVVKICTNIEDKFSVSNDDIENLQLTIKNIELIMFDKFL